MKTYDYDKGKIELLDCTLRDGGQGLESLNKSGIKTEIFTEEDKQNIIANIEDTGIEIIEIGCMTESNIKEMEQFAIYSDIETLSKYISKPRKEKIMYTGLYIDPDTSLDKIPIYSSDLVEGVRVIIRYSQLQKSIDFCKALARKGYKVFIQPMLTMRYKNDELERLVYSANEMGAYALYFVDSYGYMDELDVDRLYYFYAEKLSKEIKIGFHAHNNMDNAFCNAKYFLEELNDHDRILDVCVNGMGQGAGNLQTEILINYLNEKHGTNYKFEKVLDVCEILDKFRKHDIETWGYSPLRLIPAIHKCAYKYANAMRNEYNMSYKEINEILKNMPQELKHRYTRENLEKVLR